MADRTNERRPLKSRDTVWAQGIISVLLRTPITANQISMASVFFAIIAGFLLLFSSSCVWCLLFAGLCIQLRLLCNLLDGMLAVEGKRGSKTGILFNELPDRVSDTVIILGAGYGYAGHSILSISVADLAWFISLLAVGTAYVRAFGASVGAGNLFLGPMAKPHRMALLTGSCLSEIILCWMHGPCISLIPWALVIMAVGCIATLYRRIIKIANYLETQE